MNHAEFVKKYNNKELEILVNQSDALKVISAGYLPKQYYFAHTLWSWIWFISIPFGIIYLFIELWVGVLVLFFISFLGGKAVKKSASQFVIEHAIDNEMFYKFLIDGEVIILNEK